MENRRPTQNISLPLLDGSTVNCTLKTPKKKLSSDVRQLVVKSQMQAEACNALYALTGEINARLAQASAYGVRLKAQGASDEDIAVAMTSVDNVAAEVNAVTQQVNGLNDNQYQILCDEVAAIINIPNDADGTPRTADDIDWDECDVPSMKEAVGFFLNGAAR